MFDEAFPEPGGKLTADAFAELALAVAESRPGVTLVLTAMDDGDRQVGPIIFVPDVPVDPRTQREVLNLVIWMSFGRTMGAKIGVAYAFVQEDEGGILTAEASIEDVFRDEGLN